MKSRGIRIALATVVMMAMAGAATAQGMGIYGGLNLGFGQFGADVEQRVNDKFSLNWAMAGLGFIGHFTYDMTFGGNYHFK